MPRRSRPPTMTEQFTMVVGQTYYQSFTRFSSTEAWSPAVNIYQLADRLEIAVDLAGIEREQIEVLVEPGRLLIRGHRPAPDPQGMAGAAEGAEAEQPMRILTMEIDYGPFSRAIAIPEQADLTRVASEYREGMLWIALPFRGG